MPTSGKRHKYGAILMEPSFPNEETFADVWREEKSSLLARTEFEAKRLGAKRDLSEAQSTDDLRALLETDLPGHKWSNRRKAKVLLLTAFCVALTAVLLFYPEQIRSSMVIEFGQDGMFIVPLDDTLSNAKKTSGKILAVSLTGAFVPEEVTFLSKETITVVATKESPDVNRSLSRTWTLGIFPEEQQFKQSVVQHQFDLQEIDWLNENISLKISLQSNVSTPLLLEIQFLSDLAHFGIMLGAVILAVMYGLILFEVTHRTVITMLASTAAIGTLALVDKRPDLPEIITWIDIETLTLLFSMMLIVSILSETGIFNYIGVAAFKVSKGRIWPLIGILCFITAAVSAILDNVTTILLMTPVIIQLCEEMHIDPRHVLIANVIFSNIGGAATAIGDPPNIMIVSDADIQARGITFATFTMHVIVCVVIVAVVGFVQLRFMYGKLDAVAEVSDVSELRHEITIWHRTAQNMANVSREEAMVRGAINHKIEELMEELELKERESGRLVRDRNVGSPTFDYCITDKWLLAKAVVVLLVTVVLFFLSNFPQFNLSLGWTALLGALTLLIMADKLEVESVFARVEWSTLVFFATLFVVMEAVNKLGLLHWIGDQVEYIVEQVADEFQLTVAIVLILWVSGLTSAFVDNIPFTAMMIPVIKSLSQSNPVNLPLQPLVWALALGASLGGNGTLIGASANVVCAGIAEQHGHKFSFLSFFKIGFPITIVSLLVANAYLLICHIAVGWNGV